MPVLRPRLSARLPLPHGCSCRRAGASGEPHIPRQRAAIYRNGRHLALEVEPEHEQDLVHGRRPAMPKKKKGSKGKEEEEQQREEEDLLGDLSWAKTADFSGAVDDLFTSLTGGKSAAEMAHAMAGARPAKKRAPSSHEGRQRLLEDVALMQYGERLAEMVPAFVLETFHGLRRIEADQKLEFRTTDLERPLCKYDLEDAAKTSEMEAKAKTTFSNMLGYMGEKYHQYPDLLASQIIQDGIEFEELRDEIYLQTMIQTIQNPNVKSARRAWQLMSLLVKVFPPTEAFRPYVEVFFYHNTEAAPAKKKKKKGKGLSSEDDIVRLAQTSLRRLEVRMKEGAKESGPTEEEISALRAEQPMMLKVYFTDHSFKNFEVEDDMTIQDLLNSISATLKVVLIDTYALYDVSNAGTNSSALVVDPPSKIMNVMADWQKKVKLSNKPFAKKGIAKHNLVFSKRLYVDKPGEVPQDPVELHLLYTQAKVGPHARPCMYGNQVSR